MYYKRRPPRVIVAVRLSQESIDQTDRVARLVDETRSEFIRTAIQERRQRVIEEYQNQAPDDES